ncbi:uncharacterized protein LOC123878126 isoform X1 [Maniola jurtina]|uniref:uncharacterized protein LOC123878126 isoform X1 n=1 Tax=Maniola jurtina TaxID=191418 RepID=UPI001E687B15|nr:uncharacterized protein LOC123878126 isoform X1 [Maniola jurtina]
MKVLGVFACICVLIAATSAQEPEELVGILEELNQVVAEGLEELATIDEDTGRRQARRAGGRRTFGLDLFGGGGLEKHLLDGISSDFKTLGIDIDNAMSGLRSALNTIGSWILPARRQLEDDGEPEGELISVLDELGETVTEVLDTLLQIDLAGGESEGRRQADPSEVDEVLDNLGTAVQKRLEQMLEIPEIGEQVEETLDELVANPEEEDLEGPPDGRRFFLKKLLSNVAKSVFKAHRRSIDEPKPRSRRFLSPEKLEKVVRAGLEALLNDSEEESGENQIIHVVYDDYNPNESDEKRRQSENDMESATSVEEELKKSYQQDGRRFFLDKLFGDVAKSVFKAHRRSIDEPKPRSRRFLFPHKLFKMAKDSLKALLEDSEESGKEQIIHVVYDDYNPNESDEKRRQSENDRKGDVKERKSDEKSHRSRRDSPPINETVQAILPILDERFPKVKRQTLPTEETKDELTPLPVEPSNVRDRRNAVRRSV